VGDNVKVLVKQYSDNYISYNGVIVGFDAFKELPTIVIAYLTGDYNPELEFVYLNRDSKDVEITHARPEEMILKKEDVISKFNSGIEGKKSEIKELEKKKEYFIKYFNQYFKK